MNLFGELRNLLAGDILIKIANITGEKEEKVKVVIDGLIPTFIGGLMKRVSNEAGATTLMNVIQKGKHDGSINENLATYFVDKESLTPLLEKGSSYVSMLLPDKKSSITTMISKYAGVRNSSATMILGIVASISLDRLGKTTLAQGLDKLSLANYLLELKAGLLDETPEELQPKMIDVLGLSVFMSQEIKPIQFAPAAPIKSASVQSTITEKPTKEQKVTYSTKNYEESESSAFDSIPKWLLPSVLVLVVLSVLGYFAVTYDWSSLKSSSDSTTDSAQMEEVTGAEIDTSSLPKDTAVAKVDSAALLKDADKTISLDLPNGQKLDLPQGSFVYSFTKYLADSSAKVNRVFTVDNLTFEPNTAAFSVGSDKPVFDLAKVLQAYPKTQIKLTAYTDNAIDSLQSKRLTARRAVAVRNILIQQGINAIRIDFAGRGSQNPIASNATEEGKIKNRRIELKVVKK